MKPPARLPKAVASAAPLDDAVMDPLRDPLEFLGEMTYLPRQRGVLLQEMKLGGRKLVAGLRGRLLMGLVPIRLAGVGEEDERSGVGRLGRESKVEQDERIGVPFEAEASELSATQATTTAVCPTMY